MDGLKKKFQRSLQFIIHRKIHFCIAEKTENTPQKCKECSLYLSIYMYVCMYMYLILWNLFYNISLITSVFATVVSAGSKRLFCQYKKYFHLIETMVLYSGVW